MANVNISPNMLLPVPVPSQDPGPDWALQVYNCLFSVVDQHDHSSGKGVQVTPAGLNINSPLTFQTQQALNLLSAGFVSQTSPLSIASAPAAIYVSGGNLYFNSPSTQIQLTTPTGINATSSGISNGTATASFVSGTLVVDEAANTPANIQAGSILIGNNTAGSPFITLEPTTLTSSYPLVLPVLPTVPSFLQLDASGNITASIAITGGITGTNVANATVTATNQAPANNALVGMSGSALTSTSPQLYCTASVTLSGNRPAMLQLATDGSGNLASFFISNSSPTSRNAADLRIQLFRGSTKLVEFSNSYEVSDIASIGLPGSIINHIDFFPAAGSNTYNVYVYFASNGGTLSASFNHLALRVVEI